MLKKIAVTGASGQLGQEFFHMQQHFPSFEFTFYSKSELDISNPGDLQALAKKSAPDFLINCAAYTAVDKAETEKDKCYEINAEACKNIARVFTGTRTKVVHFSTDYVYHNDYRLPLHEEDIKCPVSVYGKSKLDGENWLRDSALPVLIIRSSWIYSSFGHNFLKTMVRLCLEKDNLNVVGDQYGAPTYTEDIVIAVMEIIQKYTHNPDLLDVFNQTYNFAPEGIITWYDFACTINNIVQGKASIHKIPSSEYLTAATRPHWSVMSRKKIKKNFNLEIPHWHESVVKCMGRLGYEAS
jgi:dTDP-4-dehydrorhamnose reductase